MSSSGTTDQRLILIVSDADDQPVRDCAAAMTNAGAGVEIAPDVYTAMARLALNETINRVLLDVRTLDERELAFLGVATRYHPSVEILVPRFNGTDERMAATGTDVQVVDVASLIASITTEPASIPAAESNAPPNHSLSTDGGPESSDAGSSLHDAVRERMAGDDPRAIRRAPPRVAPRKPDSAGQPEPSVKPVKPTLSPEEVDALLAREELDETDQQPPGDSDVEEVR